MNDGAPAQPRILVVEDETILAMMLEDVLMDQGYSVVGPFARVAAALQAAELEALDAALLDVNLAGEMVFPVAEMLARRGVPFLLMTGYDNRILDKARQDWPVLLKPYRLDDVVARLAVITGRQLNPSYSAASRE
jgi:DNA-binding response OmpR family regulator